MKLKTDVPASFCRDQCNAGKFIEKRGHTCSGGLYCPNPKQANNAAPTESSSPDWVLIAQERRDAKEAKRIKKSTRNS